MKKKTVEKLRLSLETLCSLDIVDMAVYGGVEPDPGTPPSRVTAYCPDQTNTATPSTPGWGYC